MDFAIHVLARMVIFLIFAAKVNKKCHRKKL